MSEDERVLKEARTRPDSFEAQVEAVEWLVEHGRYGEALPFLERALKLDSDFEPLYWNYRGVIALHGDSEDEAEVHFRKALERDPELMQAHFNLGVFYQMKGQYPQALEHFRQVVLAQPDDFEAYSKLGECCAVLGMEKDAEAFFAKALTLQPDFLDAEAGILSLYLKQGRYEETEELIGEFLKLHPDARPFHFMMGLLLEYRGAYEEALKHFYQVAISDPYDGDAFKHLGICCAELGMYEQAESFLAQAIKLNVEDPDATLRLGKLYLSWDRPGDAALAFREWLRLKVGDREVMEGQKAELSLVYNALAESLERSGDVEGAKEALGRSLDLVPDQPAVREKYEQLCRPLGERVSLEVE
ncbi:MAG TPA: tetratricopeptide repeat protein [Candidatus Latescibacteria bacterium]|nr:tetratricopeptide repeat protein [Candidatus Latescibacterota bacterium]